MKQKLVPKIFLVLLFFILLKPGQINSQCSSLSQTAENMGRFDYVLWSSPVTSYLLNNVSPNTLPDKFYRFDQATNSWISLDSFATNMTPGIGYLVRGPNDYWPYCTGCGLQPFTVNFSGTPNSGTISVPLTVLSTSSSNLIGNPYCNDVSADCFIRDLDNTSSINGTLYFWTHNIPIDWSSSTNNPPNPQVDGIYNYNSNGYAAYNLLGGIAAGYTPNASSSYLTLNRPDGFIARAQGFFVNGLSNGATAYFRDTMRADYNAHFFKADEPVTDDNPPAPPGSCEIQVKHRLWLQMTMPGGLFRETLVGYAQTSDGATSGPNLDRNFDGLQTPPSEGPPYVNLYSLSPGSTANLGIQARALPFSVNDVISLGYGTNTSGNATITVRNIDFDGLFVNQDFWLRETVGSAAPTYHNIKTTPYTFPVTASPTDANTRFQIVFKLPGQPTVGPRGIPCGGTLAGIGTVFQSDPITASSYSYEVRDFASGALVGTYTGGYTFTLNQVGIQFGGHYLIRVATYQVDGNWVYGPPCEIYTPAAPPTIKMCTDLDPSPITVAAAEAIWGNNHYTYFGIGPATTFRYRVINTSNTLQNTEITKSGFASYKLYLNDANNGSISSNPYTIALNTIYSVEVDVFWNGIWTGYGPKCYYQTPLTKNDGVLSSEFSAQVYPNPSENSFRLDVTTGSNEPIEAIVYDMIGRQIENFDLNANEVNSQEMGIKYPTGIYNIVVRQGDNIQTLRAVKK